MSNTYLENVLRMNKRSGQPDRLRARTVRHGHSLLPAAVEAFLAAPSDNAVRFRGPDGTDPHRRPLTDRGSARG